MAGTVDWLVDLVKILGLTLVASMLMLGIINVTKGWFD